jgi:hypothetical protein
MADRMLYIGFGEPARGREARAVEVFNASVGLYGRMVEDGRIEAFDVRLLMPNPDLGGWFELRGSAAQMAAVKEDAEFMRVMTDASLIVDRLHICDGYCDQGIAEQMQMYAEATAQVAQATA